MHPYTKPPRRIQRGPPNMFNLPDMFREIADSINRSFQRFRANRAMRRQGTSSLFNSSVFEHDVTLV